MIRVISGIYKGRSLRNVASARVRPMPDKLKGALFNILGERVKKSSFLDGFAGTGSVGLEALSRGAARAVFVEEFYPAVKVIRSNVSRCGAGDQAVIMHREFNRAVIELSKEQVVFDLVFLDPPYKLLEERNPLKVIRKRGVLKPGGIVILRHYFKTKPVLKDFEVSRVVTIGDDTLVFLSVSNLHI
jgi:16S rRNA (guanine(966)-N(2))-methyltransferase RsmD